MTLKELKKLEQLQRKKDREANEDRQAAMGFVKRKPEAGAVTPEHIIGKTPEERAEFFRKLRDEAGLL